MRMLTIHNNSAAGYGDHCWGIEGEIAVWGQVCGNRGCGCDRAYGGLNSHGSSSTVMVREVDLTVEELTEGAIGYLEAVGWAQGVRECPNFGDPEAEIRDWARELIVDSAMVADDFEIGTVLRMEFHHDCEVWCFNEVRPRIG